MTQVRTVPCRIVPHRSVSYRTVPYRTVPCRIGPYRAVSYRTVPSIPVCLKEWATVALSLWTFPLNQRTPAIMWREKNAKLNIKSKEARLEKFVF